MKHLLPAMMVLGGFLGTTVVRAEEVGTPSPVIPAQEELAQAYEGVSLRSNEAFPVTIAGRAAETFGVSARPAAAAVVRPSDFENERNARAVRAWKRSLVPFAVSQTLDITSSYGMRELNPMLAGSDGRFGAKAMAIKLSASAAIIGTEYLIVRKWPSSARWLSKLNWANALLTGGFAVHNYAIK